MPGVAGTTQLAIRCVFWFRYVTFGEDILYFFHLLMAKSLARLGTLGKGGRGGEGKEEWQLKLRARARHG
jgi:hypothetical protein